MKEFFGAGGSLAAALPDFDPRDEQLELAQGVEAALLGGRHLLAEAGTGTGKSLAYLIPALASGRRVIVATATKALQDQLLLNDIPVASTALGRDVHVAVLKGRDNYLCRRNVDLLAVTGRSAPLFELDDPASELDRLREWIATTETGDRAELDFEPSREVWSELAVGADRCRGSRCPQLRACFSEAARDRAAEAELVITNHALYLADLALRLRTGADDPLVVPEHDAVVIDEAHRLEEAAARWLGGRFALGAIRTLVRDVERAHAERAAPAPARLLDAVERDATAVVDALAPRGGRARLGHADVASALGDGMAAIETLAALGHTLRGQDDELDVLARRSFDAAADLDSCLDADDQARVAWAEPGALQWAPLDLADVLRSSLWDTERTAILVSATLEPEFTRRRLGLDSASIVQVDSPFDYAEQALIYLPEHMPDPQSTAFLDRVADEVAGLCLASGGRALVLTTSHRALDGLARRVPERVPFPTLVQGEAPRERLLERFRADVDSVLLATQTFWQGVDVPGESLSLVIMDKLPFQVPDDPLVAARGELIAADGGDPFREYQLPAAILALRQGFGRLIRGRDDRGVVAILDARLRTRGYGRAFVEALPACPVVASIADVRSFFERSASASA